jgi:hypothetical protein
VGLAVSSSTAAPQQRPLPSAFEKYVAAAVRPTTREWQSLLSGGPITKLLDSDVTVNGVLAVLNATKAGLESQAR